MGRRIPRLGVVGVATAGVVLGSALSAGSAAQRDSHRSLPAWASSGFVVYKCGNALCLMRPGGGGKRDLLRHGPWPQWDPSVSADGRLLAFRGYYGAGDGDYALYVTGTNGCGVRRLTRDIAGSPSWSPDRRWIAFDTSGAGAIWKVRPDRTELRRIAAASRAFYQDQPAWSPEGSELAFVRYVHNRGQIWLMRPDGSGKRLLHSDARASDEDPAWSHDGKSIAFVVHTGNLAGAGLHTWIDTIDAGGSNARRLTRGGTDTWNPVWLPNDSGVAFLASPIDSPGDLYVIRPDGSDQRKIAALATAQFTWADATLPPEAC